MAGWPSRHGDRGLLIGLVVAVVAAAGQRQGGCGPVVAHAAGSLTANATSFERGSPGNLFQPFDAGGTTYNGVWGNAPENTNSSNNVPIDDRRPEFGWILGTVIGLIIDITTSGRVSIRSIASASFRPIVDTTVSADIFRRATSLAVQGSGDFISARQSLRLENGTLSFSYGNGPSDFTLDLQLVYPCNAASPFDTSCCVNNATADPANFGALLDRGTVCGSLNTTGQGPCADPARRCTGESSFCLPTPLPNTTVCRAARGACEADAFCSGSSFNCPTSFLPNTTRCRTSRGVCEANATCSGFSYDCPGSFLTNATVCGSQDTAGRPCADPLLRCTGSSPGCATEAFLNSTVVCRASRGACEANQTCSSASFDCPASFLSNTSLCRNATRPCEMAAFCTGNNITCPASPLAGALAVTLSTSSNAPTTPTGATVVISASVMRSGCGLAQASVQLRFVISGAGATTLTATTNNGGRAQVRFSSAVAGTSTVVAFGSNGVASAPMTIVWRAQPRGG